MKLRPSVVVPLLGTFGLLFIIIMSLVVIGLSSNDADDDAGASPTPPSVAGNQTPTSTNTTGTPVSSPTALSTPVTRFTPTPLRFATSALPPTQIAGVPTSSVTNPVNIALTSPASGSLLKGYVTILGSASHPNFVQYALEYGPNPNPANLWYPITAVPINRTVINNALGAWNTTTVADGNYQIRLHVWLNNGVEDFRTVTNLSVQNTGQPTPSGANNNPLISPIGPISITQGNSLTIALGMTDIDNDPLTYIAQVANPSIATVTPSGSSAITINGLKAGSTNVTVTINDGRGGTASTSFSVTVNAPPPAQNNPPAISPIAAQTITTGQNLNIAISVSDPDSGDTVSVTTASSAAGVATASISGNTLTVRGVGQGSAGINVTATDSRGLSTTVSFTVTVTNPVAQNRPPTIGAPGNQTVDTGATKDVTLTIADPDNDPLTITAASSNNGIASVVIVSSNTARINGVSGGSASITITVDDKKGGSATTSFNVTVNPPPDPNNPPEIASISDQSVPVGQSITVPVTVTDSDAGDTISISAVVDPVSRATVTLSATNELVITGADVGTATVTVTATDGLASDEETFTLTVEASPNSPPLIGAINAQSCAVGDTLSISLVISDVDNDPLTVTATADNAFVTPNVVSNQLLEVDCVAEGLSNVNVVVADEDISTNTAFTVTVSAVNEPPTLDALLSPLSCTVGETPTVDLAFNDPNGDLLTVTTASDDTAIALANTLDDDTIQITCVSQGTTSITVTVDDNNGGTAQQSLSVEVVLGNAPPVLSGLNPVTCEAGTNSIVALSYNDPDGDTLTVNASSNNPSASVTQPDNFTLDVACIAEGFATVSVSVDDGNGGTAEQTFDVTVTAANQSPVLDPINPVSCGVGDAPTVSLSYSDPDGDSLTVTPSSDNGSVSVTQLDPNTLQLICNSVGGATVSVSVDDGNGGTAQQSFGVTVSAVNQSPVLDPINPVSCGVGDTPTVSLSYSDPDGDALTVMPSSDNGSVSVTQLNSNTLQLICNSVGGATVSVSVDDGNGGAAQQSFGVTVSAVNQSPVLDPINPVTCAPGEAPTVSLSYSDPDGDALTVTPSSDNGSVSVTQLDATTLQLICNATGGATVSVIVEDGNGGSAQQSFAVSVAATNNNPVLDFLPDVTCAVNDSPIVNLSYNDPDGDIVTPSANSDNSSVVGITPLDAFTLQLTCFAEGSATIQVSLDDGVGGSASGNFAVTVSGGGAPTFNILDYPQLPDLNQNVSNNIQQIRNLGAPSDAFAVIGDDFAGNPNLLTNFANSGAYQLGNQGGLQGTIDRFNATGSFNSPRLAAGSGWDVSTLFNSAASSPDFCDVGNGEAPLSCELRTKTPAIVLVLFSPNGATGLPVDEFRSNLQNVVGQITSAGGIPVLATLPDDGSTDSTTLNNYNEAIVQVAELAAVPLWNLYVTMQNAPNGVYSTGGTDAFDLNDGALSFGANRFNLAALQVLERVRSAY